MRLLFDTHAYFWWAIGSKRLSERATEAIANADAELFLSAVVPWELATKHQGGKWPGAEAVLNNLDEAIEHQRLVRLPITLDHARHAGAIASPHRDSSDRMLAAQASVDGLTLITLDPAFRTLGCETLW